MMRVFLILTLVLGAFPLALASDPAPASVQEAPQQTTGEWEQRLRALDPTRPIEYFELGEEVEDAARSAEDRALARELFGLAGLLDRQGLGRSAALAIASLEERAIARDRLRAAAELLAPVDTIDPGTRGAQSTSREGRLAFCHALGALRRGDGSRVARHLASADAEVVLEDLGPLLPGGSARFMRDAEVYSGGLRPDLDSEEVEAHLLVEMVALSPTKTSWAVALSASEGAPLMVVDLKRLDRLFGVDPTRPYWRDGRWVDRRSARERVRSRD